MKNINKILGVIIIIVNLYFIPVTLINVKESGGPMGFGLLFLPITLLINLLLIPAYFSFKTKYKNSKFLLIINSIGIIFSFILLWLFLSTPVLD
jgi:hypothetical protein|tara:strand:- start:265 stop:546 length:282 start_codon:yes stop_codon:yes gene_type:complete